MIVWYVTRHPENVPDLLCRTVVMDEAEVARRTIPPSLDLIMLTPLPHRVREKVKANAGSANVKIATVPTGKLAGPQQAEAQTGVQITRWMRRAFWKEGVGKEIVEKLVVASPSLKTWAARYEYAQRVFVEMGGDLSKFPNQHAMGRTCAEKLPPLAARPAEGAKPKKAKPKKAKPKKATPPTPVQRLEQAIIQVVRYMKAAEASEVTIVGNTYEIKRREMRPVEVTDHGEVKE